MPATTICKRVYWVSFHLFVEFLNKFINLENKIITTESILFSYFKWKGKSRFYIEFIHILSKAKKQTNKQTNLEESLPSRRKKRDSRWIFARIISISLYFCNFGDKNKYFSFSLKDPRGFSWKTSFILSPFKYHFYYSVL